MFRKECISQVASVSAFLLITALLLISCRPVDNVIVSFNTAGGTPAIECQVIQRGGVLEPVSSPRRTGFRFDGWYKYPGHTYRWDFNNGVVREDITLHARWTRTGGSGSSGGSAGGGSAPGGPSGPSDPATFSITLVRDVLHHNANTLKATEGTATVTVGNDSKTVTSSASTTVFSGIEAGTTVTLGAVASDVVINAQPSNAALLGPELISLSALQERAVFVNWGGLPSSVTCGMAMDLSFEMPASNLTINANFFPDLFVMRTPNEINRFHPNLVDHGHPTDFVIPASINGNPVSKIGARAFLQPSNSLAMLPRLANVRFSSGLITIASEAFVNQRLENVVIPGSVTNIGANAFSASIGNPATWAGPLWAGILSFETGNNPLIIGSSAFSDTNIGALVIPSRTISVENRAFERSHFSKINIECGDQSLTIGERAFYAAHDWNTVTEFAIPRRVTSIGLNAFAGNSPLSNVIVHPRNTPLILQEERMAVNEYRGPFRNWNNFRAVRIPNDLEGRKYTRGGDWGAIWTRAPL